MPAIPYLRHVLSSIQGELRWEQLIAYDYVYVRNSHITDLSEQQLIYSYIVSKMGVGSYYQNTFGASGQNKAVADFFYFFRTSGNLTARTITKTGLTLRYDIDGTVYNQNNLPTHTKGIGNGYIIQSSEDGWSGLTRLDVNTNNLIGSAPNWNLPNCTIFSINTNSFTKAPNWNLPKCISFYCYFNSFSGSAPNWNLPSCQEFYIFSNLFSGSAPNWNLPSCTFIRISENLFSGELAVILKNTAGIIRAENNDFTSAITYPFKPTITYNLQANNINTSQIDLLLHNIYLYFVSNTPTASITIQLNGIGMGVPTGGNSNVDIVAIKAIYTAAGRAATILVNSQ